MSTELNELVTSNGSIGYTFDLPSEVAVVDTAQSTSNGEPPFVSIIVPTRNEAAVIPGLVARLREAVSCSAQVVFVDDSDDTTPFEVQLQARNLVGTDNQKFSLRMIHRLPGQRNGGLGTAVQEGMRLASGKWVCVVDADLQHPPEMIETLLAKAEQDDLDIVIGSRYVEGGSLSSMSRSRRGMSRGCAVAAKMVFPNRLAGVSDPLSGFFVARRSALDVDRLEPNGFKILLELLGRHPDLMVGEVGYEFSDRYAGASKASYREAIRYARQLTTLRTARTKGLTIGPKAYYNIHDILTVASEVALPELKTFRVRSAIESPDVMVTIARKGVQVPDRQLVDLTQLTPHMRYTETFGESGFAVDVNSGAEVRVSISPFVARSPHVVYTNIVEPILRWRFVTKGYALVHAAGFVYKGEAHLITARTDTGKTTSMLKILERDATSFISDDLILVDREGTAYSYPKPLTISAHTVAALNNTDLNRIEQFFLPVQSRLHSRAGRQFAFFLTSRRIPVATLNTAVQRIIPPPKYRVEKLVPGARIEISAPIGSLSIIQAGPEEKLGPIPTETGLELLLENCEDAFGFPPYEHLAAMLKRDPSGVSLDVIERETISEALQGVPVALVTSSQMLWAEHIWEHTAGSMDVPG